MTDLDPSEHTARGLEEALRTIEDPDVLESIRDAEREGKDREWAKALIRNRIATVRTEAVDDAGDQRPATEGVDLPSHRSLDPVGIGLLRVRELVSNWFVVLVTALVITTALGGWIAYTTYVEPGTHVEERPVTVYERTATFDHRTTVRSPNVIYPEGTVLSDRPVYFTAISPILDGSFVYRYESPYSDAVTVTPRLSLILRSVDRREDGETEYWRVTRPLDSGTSRRLNPGQSLRTSFTVNVSDLYRRIDRIEGDLGASPGRPEALLVARVVERGVVRGEEIDTTASYAMRLELQQGSYTSTVSDEAPTTVRSTDRVIVPNTYGPLQRIGSLLLLSGAGFALLGLIGAKLLGVLSLSGGERELFEFASVRREYDDWITTGTLPDEVVDRPVITVDTLEGLVDVAIDTDNRVLEDPVREAYYVLANQFLYTYRPALSGRERST